MLIDSESTPRARNTFELCEEALRALQTAPHKELAAAIHALKSHTYISICASNKMDGKSLQILSNITAPKRLIKHILKNHAMNDDAVTPGSSVLHMAIYYDAPLTAAVLVSEMLVPINVTDAEGRTPLQLSLLMQEGRTLRLLLENQADTTIPDSDDRRALYLAAYYGDTLYTTSLLTALDIDVDAKNTKKRQTALHIAAEKNHPKTIALLQTYDASLTARDIDGNAPLHLAIANGSTEASMVLLNFHKEKNTSVNLKNLIGDTPLHIAARNNMENVISALLEQGADLESINFCGHTALQVAVLNLSTYAVESLLFHNANILVKNKQGLSLERMAIARYHEILDNYLTVRDQLPIALAQKSQHTLLKRMRDIMTIFPRVHVYRLQCMIEHLSITFPIQDSAISPPQTLTFTPQLNNHVLSVAPPEPLVQASSLKITI